MQPQQIKRLQGLLDRQELFDLVRRERFARDQQRFDVMRACFHDEAYVRTSWYDGTGGDAYVEASRKWMQSSSSGKHWVFPAFAKIAGDRATVESPAMIFNRVDLAGTKADFYVFCRFFSRAVRQDETWKLMSFEVLFERDALCPVNAGEALTLDLPMLDTLRPSYRFLSYIQLGRGVKVNPDLLGDDRPERLKAFHQVEDRWLSGES